MENKLNNFESTIKDLEDKIKDKELGKKQYERDSQINLANACFNDIKELEINLRLAKQLKEIVEKAIDERIEYIKKFGLNDVRLKELAELRKALGVKI